MRQQLECIKPNRFVARRQSDGVMICLFKDIILNI